MDKNKQKTTNTRACCVMAVVQIRNEVEKIQMLKSICKTIININKKTAYTPNMHQEKILVRFLPALYGTGYTGQVTAATVWNCVSVRTAFCLEDLQRNHNRSRSLQVMTNMNQYKVTVARDVCVHCRRPAAVSDERRG